MSYYQVCKRSLACKPLLLRSFWFYGSVSVYTQCLKQLRKIFFTFSEKYLTAAILCTIFYVRGLGMTIREIIRQELKRRGWSYYRLAKELKGKMPARTVYAYLAGDCDLVSERVSIILESLELTIERKPKKTTKGS